MNPSLKRWKLVFIFTAGICAGLLLLMASGKNRVVSEQSQSLAKAVDLLFAQGLADPRGGEYRQIKVMTGGIGRAEGIPVETHGWLLPADGKNLQRFAVCWNGLVYPVMDAGEPCSVEQDARALLALLNRIKERNPEHQFPSYANTNVTWEGRNISSKAWMSIKCALLLRTGQTGLASELWLISHPKPDGGETAAASAIAAAYDELARGWLFSIYDRGMCAYVRKDYELASTSVRQLAKIAPEVRKKALELRGKPYREYEDPYDFLDDNPDFPAEVERRIKEPPHATVIETGIEKFPVKAERIKALIRDLDEVDVTQMSQPGAVEFFGSPIVQALVSEGEDAVEPLLDCMEKDRRFTRSVGFGRDFFPKGRRVLRVNSAAYTALANILEKPFEEIYDRKLTWPQRAAVIRAYWEKRKGENIEDRWFATLADDNASPNEWIEAGQNIVRPRNVRHMQNSSGGDWWQFGAGNDTSLRGESLRAKKNPSVEDLLVKRIKELPRKVAPNKNDQYSEALDIAQVLLDWEGETGAETARQLCNATVDYFAEPKNDLDSHGDKGRSLATITQRLVELGDGKILNDYAGWLKKADPSEIHKITDNELWKWFYPLWKNRDTPVMQQTAAYLFADGHSPWLRYFRSLDRWRGGEGFTVQFELLKTPLIGLEAFRKMAMEGLTNRIKAGECSLGENWTARFEPNEYGEKGEVTNMNKTEATAKGLRGNETFRCCDFFAFYLRDVEGMPDFELGWPEEKRDRAIAEMIRLLQRYGDHIGCEEEIKPGKLPDHFKTRLFFSKLGHPATSADEQAGRAIFSLPQESMARVVPMEQFPMKAHWTALNHYPSGTPHTVSTTIFYAPGKSREFKWPENDGYIWQVEEGFISGKWQRFFGFVSEHCIARVPAEEIEFEPDDTRGRLENGFDLKLQGRPEKKADDEKNPELINLSVQLFNRGALEQNVPQTLYRESEKSMAEGVDVHLYRKKPQQWGEQDEYDAEEDTAADDHPKPEWQEVAMKKMSRFTLKDFDRKLTPGTQYEAMAFELHDLFDMTEPGMYCLGFTFDKAKVKFTGGSSQYITFEVK